MKKLHIILACFFAVSVVISSCKKESKEETPAPEKQEQKEPEQPQGPIERDSATVENTVKWGDSEYTVVVTRRPDKSLESIIHEDAEEEYVDNEVIVKVLRDDDSEAISKKYTKNDFKSYIAKKQLANYSLLNIRYEEENGVVNGKLNFTVAVGDPDESNEDFVTLQMLISKTGDVSIRQLVLDEKTGEEAELNN